MPPTKPKPQDAVGEIVKPRVGMVLEAGHPAFRYRIVECDKSVVYVQHVGGGLKMALCSIGGWEYVLTRMSIIAEHAPARKGTKQ
jgi:hypothetical protein